MNNIRWMSLYGRFDVGTESIRFIPTLGLDEGAEVSAAQIASNLEFAQGDISFDVLFQDSQSVSTVVFNTNNAASQLHVGLNLGGAFGIAKYNGSWDVLASVGAADQLVANQVYHVRVSVRGKKIRMYVNDVFVVETEAEVRRSPIHLYAYGRKELTFSRFQCDRAKVFVALSESLQDWCGSLVQETLGQALFEPTYVDLQYSAPNDVYTTVEESVAIITSVSADYPFGFFNTGLAQGLRKPAAVLCHRSDRADFTFPTMLTQMIFHDNSDAALEHVKRSLVRYLQSVY